MVVGGMYTLACMQTGVYRFGVANERQVETLPKVVGPLAGMRVVGASIAVVVELNPHVQDLDCHIDCLDMYILTCCPA